MLKRTDPQSGSFLGGGPRFNQAGENVPLPGEKVAEAPPPPLLGGPRIWVGIVVVLVLIGVLWMVYGNGIIGGPAHPGKSISAQDRPADNPDAIGH